MIQFMKKKKLAARHFTPLSLSSYDALSKDIRWVGAFEGLIKSEIIAALLHEGLVHFPHLSGSICQQTWSVIPRDREIEIEVASSDLCLSFSQIEAMPNDRLCALSMPDQNHWSEQEFLIGAKLVHFTKMNLSLIGFQISHCLVDGVGLNLFLQSALLSLSGEQAPVLKHERSLLKSVKSPKKCEIPQGYQLNTSICSFTQQENKNNETAAFITLPVAEIKKAWRTDSLNHARLELAAWLSSECKKAEPKLTELAVWCDVRGIALPKYFTGNCGCFLHYPLSDSQEKMKQHWKHLTSRQGFQRIAEVFSQLQEAERKGEELEWNHHPNLLHINLLPNRMSHIDFGVGRALFTAILDRNTAGIRVSLTPDKTQFLLEIELPQSIQQHLIDAAKAKGFSLKQRATERFLT